MVMPEEASVQSVEAPPPVAQRPTAHRFDREGEMGLQAVALLRGQERQKTAKRIGSRLINRILELRVPLEREEITVQMEIERPALRARRRRTLLGNRDDLDFGIVGVD